MGKMKDFVMQLPRDVEFILGKMKTSGFAAHVVGGSVRDAVIGRSHGDYDITTNALPEQTKAVFDGYRIIETGIKHGTVTLLLDGEPYEITTYRVDGDYKDNRHPESVTFTSLLEEDLMRRDFTVNAMAYNPDTGTVDPFGGRSDAADKLIRAVGDPYRRFDEDALRILRALRFASTLGFEIEERTATAVRERAYLLSSISRERVYVELKKLIMGVDAVRILTEYADVIAPTLCGLNIKRLPCESRLGAAQMHTRFSALFLLNSDSPAEHAERAFTELKTDKLTRSRVSAPLFAYECVGFADVKETLRHLCAYGEQTVKDTLDLGILCERFGERESENYAAALASGIPYTVGQLKIKGGDVAALGFRGQSIGEVLSALLDAVIDGRVANERSALLGYLGTLKNGKGI